MPFVDVIHMYISKVFQVIQKVFRKLHGDSWDMISAFFFHFHYLIACATATNELRMEKSVNIHIVFKWKRQHETEFRVTILQFLKRLSVSNREGEKKVMHFNTHKHIHTARMKKFVCSSCQTMKFLNMLPQFLIRSHSFYPVRCWLFWKVFVSLHLQLFSMCVRSCKWICTPSEISTA